MGSPSRQRKNYKMDRRTVASAIANVPPDYVFRIYDVDIDLRPYRISKQKRNDIAWAFATILWRRRNEISDDTVRFHLIAIDRFFEHLHGEVGRLRLDELDSEVISYFIYWLKYIASKRDQSGSQLSESTKRKLWGVIRSYITDLINYGILDENIELPTQVFDSSEFEPFAPFSKNETKQIISACNHDLALIERGVDIVASNSLRSAYLAPLIPYAILVSLRTGLNPEVLFELEIPKYSLKKSYLLDSTLLILPIKKRAGKNQNIELLENREHGFRVKNSIVKLLEDVEELTRKARQKLAKDDPISKKLWLVESDEGKVDVFRNFNYYLSIRSFCKRHRIVDDQDRLVNMNFRRFRPTFSEIMLKLNGGDVRDLQKRLGHSHIRTTMGYIDPNLEERVGAFKYSGKAMVNWALKGESEVKPEVIANELNISLDSARKLAGGEFDMGATKCKDPFKSPLDGVEEGVMCTNYLACFRCGNCVVLKEDSHRLFSFYFWLKRKKVTLGEEKWQASYGWIIDIIDKDIAPLLGNESWVEQEKQKALDSPFPMWGTLNSGASIVEADLLV